MLTDFIPSSFPQDSINASLAEIQEVLAWAEAQLNGADESPLASDFLLSTEVAPFSFTHNSKPSSDFIATWNRVTTKDDQADRVSYVARYTDPATGLCVTVTAKAFKEFPAVEWLIELENMGSVDTPVIEDIATVDVTLLTDTAATPVVLHQLHGDSCGEMSFLPYDTVLGAGRNLTLVPTRGRPSQETAFPFGTCNTAIRES
jgi:hypothetical protein